MSWEISAALGQVEPPYQMFAASSPNVSSWQEEVLTLPDGDELGFRRRTIMYISCRAINNPASSQVSPTERVATYCYLSRGGRKVTPHIITLVYNTSLPTLDGEDLPLFWWKNPFFSPARGGDNLTILVPGDADATPIQDWELNVLMGPELR